VDIAHITPYLLIDTPTWSMIKEKDANAIPININIQKRSLFFIFLVHNSCPLLSKATNKSFIPSLFKGVKAFPL